MRICKLFFKALLLSLLMGLILAPNAIRVSAADKPDKPQITLTESKDGKTIKVTIHTTEGADGYKIYIKGSDDTKFKALKTIKKDGTQERSYTIKKMDAGKYSIRVKAYNKVDGKTVWSSYSKIKKAQIIEKKDEPTDDKQDDSQELVKEPEKDQQNPAGNDSVEDPEPQTKEFDFSSVKAGDIIQFGSYEQDNVKKNGKEPIDWIVLERTDDELFVVSRYILDWHPYHDRFGEITWEKCTLRQWLNEDFYHAAFDEDEKKLIKTTTIKNEDNPVWNTEGGNDTLDKLFLLSMRDVLNPNYGFDKEMVNHNSREDINRRCACTEYARARGVFVQPGLQANYMTTENRTASSWWLRSIGGRSDQTTGGMADHVLSVSATGIVGDYGIGAYGTNNKGGKEGVRPAMQIKVKP